MPIQFQSHPNLRYVMITWLGSITDHEMLSAFDAFQHSETWQPQQLELSDFSQADLRQITSDGLRRRADFVTEHLIRHQVPEQRCAAYVTDDHDYGMLRIYDALTIESPVKHEVFRNLLAARAWLLHQDEDESSVCCESWVSVPLFVVSPATSKARPTIASTVTN